MMGQTMDMNYCSFLCGLTENILNSFLGKSPRVAVALVETTKFSCGNSITVFTV